MAEQGRLSEGGNVLQWNHVANRLNPAHCETVIGMLNTKLGFVELWREERAIWMRQAGVNVEPGDGAFRVWW